MKLSTFLSLKSIVCLVFGIGFAAFPFDVIGLYGAEINVTGVMMARFFGAAFIGIGMILWWCRDAETDTLKSIIFALCCADTIGFVVALRYQLAGVFNWLGWINVALWLIFAGGLAYYRFLKTSGD